MPKASGTSRPKKACADTSASPEPPGVGAMYVKHR